jgi:spore maturation protein CgeB
VKCVKYYLQADVDRVAVAARGRRRVMAQHLWSHRLEQLIPRVELHLLRTAVAV